jgi:hypothetical protein
MRHRDQQIQSQISFYLTTQLAFFQYGEESTPLNLTARLGSNRGASKAA